MPSKKKCPAKLRSKQKEKVLEATQGIAVTFIFSHFLSWYTPETVNEKEYSLISKKQSYNFLILSLYGWGLDCGLIA